MITGSVAIATALIAQPLYSRAKKAESSSLEQTTNTLVPNNVPIIKRSIKSASNYETQWDLRKAITNPQSSNLQICLKESKLKVIRDELDLEKRIYSLNK